MVYIVTRLLVESQNASATHISPLPSHVVYLRSVYGNEPSPIANPCLNEPVISFSGRTNNGRCWLGNLRHGSMGFSHAVYSRRHDNLPLPTDRNWRHCLTHNGLWRCHSLGNVSASPPPPQQLQSGNPLAFQLLHFNSAWPFLSICGRWITHNSSQHLTVLVP